MKRRNVIAIGGLVALLMLVVPACSLLDDDDSSSSGATLSVYGTDAPGDVTSLRVELVGVKVFLDASDDEGYSLSQAGSDNIVDLVAAANSGTPGKFAEYDIPPGSYKCAEGTLNLVDFTIEGEAETCTSASNLPDTISTSKLCLPGDFAVVVGEGGQVDLVFDIPVLSGSRDPETDVCTLDLDLRGRRLMRLADM